MREREDVVDSGPDASDAAAALRGGRQGFAHVSEQAADVDHRLAKRVGTRRKAIVTLLKGIVVRVAPAALGIFS